MRHYSNVSKQMSLLVAIDLDDTSMTVNDASGLPSSYPFNVVIDYGGSNVEIASVTNVASNVLTIVRGQEDTASANHTVGAVVVHAATALDFQDIASHINGAANVHGIGASSDVVGTQNPQTLFNKNINGANGNVFANIPRNVLTGSESNLTVNQTNAATPGFDLIPAGTPTANIVNSPYWVIDTAGVTRLIGKTAAADVLRIYNTTGITIRARIDETGRAFTIGLTTTGSITATGQSIACGSITATGLLTLTGGIAFNSGTTTYASGTTLTIANGASISLAGALSVTATGTFTTASGAVVTFGSSATFNGTTAFNSLVNLNTASQVNLDSNTLQRGGSDARLLMDAQKANLASNATAVGAVNSIQDLATYTFTTPTGKTAVVHVDGMADILGTASTTATFELLLQVDGSLWTAVGPAVTTTTSIRYTLGKSWVVTGLTAGSHTIKLQYRNTNGNTTCVFEGSDSRTGFTALTFW